MSKHSSIFEVFTKSIKLYYREFSDVTVNNIMLADSSGNIIDIDDLSKWKLGDYYAVNAYTPSRHKLYTVLNLSQVFFSINVCDVVPFY